MKVAAVLAAVFVLFLASPAWSDENFKVEPLPNGSRLETFSLFSKSMDRPIPVAVIVPPKKEGHPEKLPVLYAFHGRDASYLTFRDMKGVVDYLVDHPMLLVSFQADKDSAYIDATVRPASLFTTFFFDELMPAIAARYPVDGQQAMMGFSMGGFGALHYLLLKPELFSSASLVSCGFMYFVEKGERPRVKRHMEELVGPRETNPAAYAAHELGPRLVQSVMSGVKLPPLLLFCGASDDVVLESNRAFLDLLAKVNVDRMEQVAPEVNAWRTKAKLKGMEDVVPIPGATPDPKDAKERREIRARAAAVQQEFLVDYEYRESPGEHDFRYWNRVFPDVMAFAYKNFRPSHVD